jgi:hypothetical protein
MKTLRSVPLALWLAALIALIFGALSALGLRDWVSILSGTPVPGVPYEAAALGGALYVLAYFGAVLLAPILAIAGAVSMLSGRVIPPA